MNDTGSGEGERFEPWAPSLEQDALLEGFTEAAHVEAAAVLFALIEGAAGGDRKALAAMLRAAKVVKGWGAVSTVAEKRFRFLQSLREPFNPDSLIDQWVRRYAWGELDRRLLTLDPEHVARVVASRQAWAAKAAVLSSKCGAFADKANGQAAAIEKFKNAQRDASRAPRTRPSRA